MTSQMWRPVENAATDISKSWRVKPNEQRWTSDRDPGISLTSSDYTHPPSNYTFYYGRSARNELKLLEACYVMLHMIPINPCDCSHKNVSDNSSYLILWCPFHATLDAAFSLRACSQSSRQKRVSQNPLPLYRIHWSFASTLYFSSGGPRGCFSLQLIFSY